MSERPECDLVMKGGIASGIVYPRAIARLAAHYRLRSVGGASAGAIAAAAAAAAEYGRDRGGFERLEVLPDLLAQTDDGTERGATRLFRLFRPQPKTARLYHLLVAGLMPEQPRWSLAIVRWSCAAVRHFPLAAFASALVAAVVVAPLAARIDPAAGGVLAWLASAAALVLGLLVFALGLAACIVGHALRAIPANGYGLCSGLGDDADTLTPWLHATLQSLAGLPPDRPLCFGDLWRGHDPARDYVAASARLHADERAIDLRLMTTALSHGRPYSFPLESEAFCFDADEMRALFPASIVDALVAHSPERIDHGELAGRYRLPAMEDLPVIVPVRMSLAFPLLLSAVPLWRTRMGPDPSRRGRWIGAAERVWFSDGGICSNFPIHYFDALVPSRPTFGINLVDAEYLPAQAQDPDDFVWMPDHNGSGATTRTVPVERGGLRGFLGAIVMTMQDWTDSMQLAIPGYRDRVVAVRLRASEGGLNLRMAPALIHRIATRGARAGELLLAHYARPEPPPGSVTGWRNHRWVRYRVAMRVLGEALEALREAEALTADGDAALQPMHADPPSYDFASERQRDAALRAYRELLALADRYAAMREELGYPPFDHGPHDGPRPRPELRIRPPL
ncbi:patatin-like phospholipase family protein [Dokdonella fugitiva]|jgi:predicted acylesterase/phospholipase RssA|uniref:Patatin-like phospholipase n=1 Tax=Dokdonella fugitiva TaxID=328517 RepID=A0A4R2I151_9GAMM|nr:patatin-like phospholipase family protein [Dokdonella fugitiva]MBA8884663.1 putative acylesterase/phospholipase RssA [Dokdonella fugitiva]TCO37753.1 patatin-like phospholipase [Dokdonella fugitiva]